MSNKRLVALTEEQVRRLMGSADSYDSGITIEEARLVADTAASMGSCLAGQVHIVDGREVYPEHPAVAKFRHFTERSPDHAS